MVNIPLILNEMIQTLLNIGTRIVRLTVRQHCAEIRHYADRRYPWRDGLFCRIDDLDIDGRCFYRHRRGPIAGNGNGLSLGLSVRGRSVCPAVRDSTSIPASAVLSTDTTISIPDIRFGRTIDVAYCHCSLGTCVRLSVWA